MTVRIARWLAFALAGLTIFLLAGLVILNSSAGHRFIADRIENLSPESGLKIRVGRIEGSLWRQPVVRDLRFSDPGGQFLTVREARIDWHPLDYLWRGRLTIDRLHIPDAELSRLPKLRPGPPDQPILPDFDIVIGQAKVDRLTIAAGVAGARRVATMDGRADIRSGNADVLLDSRLIDGGDRLRLALIAAPDRGDFDVDADIVAPRGGVLATMAGLDRDLTGVIRGKGDWRNWRGALLADSGDAAVARLVLGATNGRYTATGRLRPDLIAGGVVQRLTAGGVALDAAGTFADRRWDGRLALVAEGLRLDSEGQLDLGRNRFAAMRIDGWLRQPSAVLEGMAGQNMQLALLLDGGFQAPRFRYRLTAPWLSFGRVRLSGLEARGEGAGNRTVMQVPVNLSMASATGLGPLAEGIVRNLEADGVLAVRDGIVTSDLLRVRSDGLDGRFTLLANLRRGDYALGFDGTLPGLEVRGLGRVDLASRLDARRAQGGGFTLTGSARAALRRLDNGFLRGLTGGLPTASSGIRLGPDGILRFDNVRITSPLLTLTGSGLRRADGTFQLSGAGAHRSYGPATISLDGAIDRPRLTVRLPRPLPAAQLSDVTLNLVPAATGFDFVADGGSLLGPFEARGQILLPANLGAVIDMQGLAVGGTTARGRLAVANGGLAGQLLVAGGGLDGSIILSVPDGIQRMVANLTARDARFAGPPPILIRRGQVNAVILLDPRGTDIDATFQGSGLQRGALSIARIAGNARLVDGAGMVRASLAGARGRDFSLQLTAQVGRNRTIVRGQGTLDRQAIRLARPVIIHRDGAGWRLESSELSYGGGRVRLSGRFEDGAVDGEASLDNLPLSLLNVAWPDLGLGGRASGRLIYQADGAAPTGEAQLRLIGLSRSGLTESSAPVDVALNAALSESSFAARAVVRRGGTVLGRVQGRVSPLADGGNLIDRIARAPLFAQARYTGEAGTLWRLTGIETLALSGPLELAADIGGTLADPSIRGVVRARNARFESYQTGTIVTGISAVGRFDGSRLQLRNISGQTPGGGTITGGGDFDLAAARGFAIDLRLDANNALLVQRDDLVARVTGPVRIASDGTGGLVSGRLTLNRGSFRLGRATEAEALPVINVVEINAPADRPVPRVAMAPWRLDLQVRGRNGFIVTGLGLESEWSTDIAVRGNVENFAITGVANLVRGDYNFAGRRFELESGTIRFTGSTPVDPVLDIVAVDDIAGIDASIRVRGTGLRPEITFASNPQLPEDELLSRILFGASITDISVTEAAQLGVALASLRSGGDGLDPINAIRRATGLDRLRILPANTELGSGTSVAAGKYVTRRVFVEIITDGQGYSATRIEYQITRWLALLGSVSTIGQESVNLRVKRDY
ncbi:translocation/assembly module TamB [Sphingomonas lacunae]|uniref:Translocation/assembly module TamB n=1 Tax=Sphingomonas lacunae TaxID=2698828 RepID=A0A6M4ARD6_9SPHN|nr:translocation/assembly module TamB domain-containing protein [Sphingomonas lacunae]QJQ31595.1 translocation/assembly module TamB [Sphingomonas lacunae]